MANKKKEVYKPGPMTEGKRAIIQGLLQEYDIESAADIQEALKDLLGGTIKEMMEAEMDEHLDYSKSERSDNDDYRNGYKSKRITTSCPGLVRQECPHFREGVFLSCRFRFFGFRILLGGRLLLYRFFFFRPGEELRQFLRNAHQLLAAFLQFLEHHAQPAHLHIASWQKLLHHR